MSSALGLLSSKHELAHTYTYLSKCEEMFDQNER